MANYIMHQIWMLCCSVHGPQVHELFASLASTKAGDCVAVQVGLPPCISSCDPASAGVQRIIITATNLKEAREALRLACTDGTVHSDSGHATDMAQQHVFACL
jgi:hypothetical protein